MSIHYLNQLPIQLSSDTSAVFGLLAVTILSIWLPNQNNKLIIYKPWPTLLSITLGVAWLFFIISLVGIIWITALTTCLIYKQQFSQLWAKYTLHTIASILALALALHLLPGFNNPVLLPPSIISDNAPSFQLYVNLDKAVAGLLILGILNPTGIRSWSKQINTHRLLMICTIIIPLLIGLATQTIRLDIKIGWITLIFALVNLLFTCVAEEAFFRLLIQAPLAKSLSAIKYSKWIVVSIMGLLFGVAHLGGGLSFALMAGLAGFGFSLVYQRTQSIELTILTHFGLNIIHFVFFTYPLAHQ